VKEKEGKEMKCGIREHDKRETENMNKFQKDKEMIKPDREF